MLAITDYPAFVVAILLFLAIPGPGNLAIVSSTAQGRVRGGLAATLGIIAGDQILMWCAVAGVAALLKTYPAAFAAVQWLGAAYLAGLAVGMWSDRDEIASLWRAERRFEPTMSRDEAAARMARWDHAVRQVVAA